jgi:AraC family transcriptional regulator of arabinose operon
MRIVNCGYGYTHGAEFEVRRPNGSGDYMLLLLHSPSVHFLGGEYVSDGGSSVIIYKRGTPQIYRGQSELVNDWVHFEPEENELSLLGELGIPLEQFISLESLGKLSSIVRRMCQENYSGAKNSEKSSSLYMNLLFYKLSDLMSESSAAGEMSELYRRLSRQRERIYSDPQSIEGVGDIARAISVSLSYLQHKWREFFGVTVMHDITAARLEYAKYLLFSTDYGICAIAKMCGYDNDVHFMRVFKQNTGQTPSEYRRDNASTDGLRDAMKKHNFKEKK